MYEAHFHFRQAPFSIAPDPEFLYLSDGHREALAHLTYGLSHGGFVLITGEVGTGKTTLLRNLLKQTPDDLDVAFVLNPRLTVRELLETLCDELGVADRPTAGASVKQYIDALNRHLLETHRRGRGTVVIIDEAQNLSPAVLEQIRLLTNLETDKRKLLRIILIGQPELDDMLARNDLRQLAQRITARYHLGSLAREDTYAYVVHRLARAGGNPHLFTRAALRRLFAISHGVPRVINLVADRALLGAYAQGRGRVSGPLVSRAAAEVLGRPRRIGRWLIGGAVAALAAGAASAYFLLPQSPFARAWDPDAVPPAAVTSHATTPTLDSTRASSAAAPAPQTRRDDETDAASLDDANTAARTAAAVGESVTDGVSAPEESPPGDAAETVARRDDPNPPGAEGRQSTPNDEALADARKGAAEFVEDDAAAQGAARDTDVERVPLQPPSLPAFETQRLAYEAVLERWGADMSGWDQERIPCNFAPRAGLQCLSRTGSWSDIRRLNLPVVLELWGQGSAPFYGALTEMHGDALTLHLGRSVLNLSSDDLRDAWFGSFVLLWQMPPDYAGTLKRGDRHPTVRWLRRQLVSLGIAQPDAGDATLFDAALQDAVMTFQHDEQLLADGIVGPATWIRLGARLALPAPALDG